MAQRTSTNDLRHHYSLMDVMIDVPSNMFADRSRTSLDVVFMIYDRELFRSVTSYDFFEGDYELTTGSSDFDSEVADTHTLSPFVEFVYYKSSSEIDFHNKKPFTNASLESCSAFQIQLPHTQDAVSIGSLGIDTGAGIKPVCRYYNESVEQFMSACLVAFEGDHYTICNCSSLPLYFDIGYTSFWDVDLTDFIPKANTLTEEDIRNITPENLAAHPLGIIGVVVTTSIFVFLGVLAHFYDKHQLKRANEERLKRIESTHLVTDGVIEWQILTNPSATKKTKVFKVWLYGIRNNHIVAGMFLRSRNSTFNSVERVAVFYAFVMGTLAISAIFYGDENNVASWVVIAVISSLCSEIPHKIFVHFFIHSRTKQQEAVFGSKILDEETVKAEYIQKIETIRRETEGLYEDSDVSDSQNSKTEQNSGNISGNEVNDSNDNGVRRQGGGDIELAQQKKTMHLGDDDSNGSGKGSEEPSVSDNAEGKDDNEMELYKKKHLTDDMNNKFLMLLGIYTSERVRYRSSYSYWAKKLSMALVSLWVIACAILIIIYGVKFDIEAEQSEPFFQECLSEEEAFEQAQNAALDWFQSVLFGTLQDIFLFEPLIMFLFSFVAVRQTSRMFDPK